MIYFDNSATTVKKPDSVSMAVYKAIASGNYGNPSRGSHDFSLNALEGLYKTRSVIADFFGVEDPLKVVLVSNVTTGLNLAIRGLLSDRDHVITSDAEHNSVLRPLYQLENLGAEISFLPLDKRGNIEIEKLEESLRPSTKAVVITQASNVSGIATDLDYVFDFCIKNNLILIVDGAQGAGTLNFKLRGRKFPDMVYAFTGHKSLYGPQGTGGLIFVGDLSPKAVFSGGSGIDSFNREQPNMLPDIFEYGTQNIHSNLGLLEGIKYLNDLGMEKVEDKLHSLANYFYNEVSKNKNVTLYNEFHRSCAPIVSLNVKDYSSGKTSDILWNKYKVATRGGSHCAQRYHESMGTKERGMVRFSFSTFNTFKELDYVLEVLEII
ncbi:aminotransferase class V-fold PLP-dependent enzyme [Anaerosphaera multitolerans]|uniref:Aminotransferase class V-fold PLP-dependent enzyme n=1 Tax=Anaerosphaera multitolerans TaxID=2487351 RepID=A0A437S9C4_9FIRM|nr:aminotransferase class V-fold PLP-dependent enzyme [Anaerosphaera multitolerans]RVU55501.1 aminotransferase class V-fold PLP-dependent enzyme [Anaerosphaera multitolerans]